jgi:hypothetical protein
MVGGNMGGIDQINEGFENGEDGAAAAADVPLSEMPQEDEGSMRDEMQVMDDEEAVEQESAAASAGGVATATGRRMGARSSETFRSMKKASGKKPDGFRNHSKNHQKTEGFANYNKSKNGMITSDYMNSVPMPLDNIEPFSGCGAPYKNM